MKNKKLVYITALAVILSMGMSACSFGKRSQEEEQVIVEETPTPEAPEPTEAPQVTPTPTIAPDIQTTTYTSADQSVSIELPDATWSNKMDEPGIVSFQSPDAGDILIMHGEGEETMSAMVIPSTEDMAVTLQQASEMEEGTDFEIQDFTAEDVNGIGVYSYVTHILNTEKSDGTVYIVNKYFASADEYYSLTGTVKTEEALDGVKESVESFAILGDSALKAAAPAPNAPSGTAPADGTQAADGTETSGETDGAAAPAGELSEEAMSDTSQSRTIYRNSDGAPLVIQADGNGGWVDSDGNTYEFATDEDVYDQDGVDYYYHGEAADVYYMPLPSDDEEDYEDYEDYEE